MIMTVLIIKGNISSQNWPQIPDHPYRILISGGSGSAKKCIT